MGIIKVLVRILEENREALKLRSKKEEARTFVAWESGGGMEGLNDDKIVGHKYFVVSWQKL